MQVDGKNLKRYLEERKGPQFLVQSSRQLRILTYILALLVVLAGVAGVVMLQRVDATAVLIGWSLIVWVALIGNLGAVLAVTRGLEKQSKILKLQFESIQEWRIEFERLYESYAVDMHHTTDELDWQSNKIEELLEFVNDMDELKAKMEKVEKEQESVTRKVKTATTKVNKNTKTVKMLGEKLEEQDNQFKTLTEEANNLGEKLEGHDNQFKTLTEEADTFKKGLEESNSGQNKVRKGLNNLESSLNQVRSELQQVHEESRKSSGVLRFLRQAIDVEFKDNSEESPESEVIDQNPEENLN